MGAVVLVGVHVQWSNAYAEGPCWKKSVDRSDIETVKGQPQGSVLDFDVGKARRQRPEKFGPEVELVCRRISSGANC